MAEKNNLSIPDAKTEAAKAINADATKVTLEKQADGTWKLTTTP